jgi:sugar (pentulose or hexulose) kinase
MAMKYRQLVETITRVTGKKIDVLHIVGGGVRNSLLCQLTSNALGIPVVAGPVEATAMGNMLIQIMAAGEADSVDDARKLLRSSFDVTEYMPRDTDAWLEAYAKYLKTIGRQ